MPKILLMFPQVAPQAIIIPRSRTAGQGQVGRKEYSTVKDRWMVSQLVPPETSPSSPLLTTLYSHRESGRMMGAGVRLPSS